MVTSEGHRDEGYHQVTVTSCLIAALNSEPPIPFRMHACLAMSSFACRLLRLERRTDARIYVSVRRLSKG